MAMQQPETEDDASIAAWNAAYAAALPFGDRFAECVGLWAEAQVLTAEMRQAKVAQFGPLGDRVIDEALITALKLFRPIGKPS